MNVNLKQPPVPTGNLAEDISRLYSYAAQCAMELNNVLIRLDDKNIIGIDISCVSGDIELEKHSLVSDMLTVTNDGFRLQNSDGSQYIELSDDEISI